MSTMNRNRENDTFIYLGGSCCLCLVFLGVLLTSIMIFVINSKVNTLVDTCSAGSGTGLGKRNVMNGVPPFDVLQQHEEPKGVNRARPSFAKAARFTSGAAESAAEKLAKVAVESSNSGGGDDDSSALPDLIDAKGIIAAKKVASAQAPTVSAKRAPVGSKKL